MSNLCFPDDLVFDVLSWLPVKSLTRFKQLSKSWCSRIESREFAKMHLNRLTTTNSNTRFVYRSLNDVGIPDLYIIDCITNVVKQLVYPISRNISYSLLGSANGVLCIIYDHIETIVLWNPLSQNYYEVLVPEFSTPTIHATKERNDYYGFGYDKTSDDYKVVVFVKFSDINTKENYYNGWMIYSLKLKIWKKVEIFPYDMDNYMYGNIGILVSGALHWITSDSRLLAFDLAAEKFNIVSQPDYSDKIYSRYVGSFGDCVSLMCKSSTDYRYQFWVMKDYGNTDSWTRIDFNLPCNKEYWYLVPIAYLKSKKQVVFQNGTNLHLYDFEKQSMQKVDKHPYTRAFTYLETLECFDGSGTSDEINARVTIWNERTRRRNF